MDVNLAFVNAVSNLLLLRALCITIQSSRSHLNISLPLSFRFFIGIRTNGKYKHIVKNLLTKYMKKNVKDPELIKKLIPDYEVTVYLKQSRCNIARDF